jgi:hypothetical protein
MDELSKQTVLLGSIVKELRKVTALEVKEQKAEKKEDAAEAHKCPMCGK